MTYEYRSNVEYFFGTLDMAAAISDTSLTSVAFSALGTGYTTGTYLPLVLHDPISGFHEVVWVTGHVAASEDVTVVRGREGTSARAWPGGTQVVCAPTAARDNLGFPVAFASLPSDPNIGLRVPVTDRSYVAERTNAAGWQPSVGVASYLDVGPCVTSGGANPPTGAAILVRAGMKTQTSGVGGLITCTFRTPFPNGLICGVVQQNQTNAGNVCITGVGPTAGDATKLNIYTWVNQLETANVTVTYTYIALGY